MSHTLPWSASILFEEGGKCDYVSDESPTQAECTCFQIARVIVEGWGAALVTGMSPRNPLGGPSSSVWSPFTAHPA